MSDAPDARPSRPSSDRVTLAKGAGVGVFGRSAARGLMLVQQAIFARLLGPSSYGVFAIAWSILLFAVNFAPLGLHHTIIRFGAGRWDEDPAAVRDTVRRCVGMAMVTATVAAAILFLLSGWLADTVFEMPELGSVLRWFSVAVAGFALLRVVAAGTRLSRDMRYSVLAEDLTPPVVGIVLFLILYFGWGWGLRGAAVATTLSVLVALILAVVLLRRTLPRGSGGDSAIASRAELLSFSAVASLAGLFSFQSQRVDRLMVGYFLGDQSAGIYQAAAQSAAVVGVFLAAFNAIFSPMISGMYAQGDMGRLAEIYRVSAKWGFYLTLPFFLTALSSPSSTIGVLFGAEYTAGADVLVIILLSNLFAVSTGGVGLLLTMTGDQNRWFVYSAAMMALNLGLGVALIPRFGLVGAAISTSTVSVTLFSLGLFRARKRLGVWPYDRRHLKGLLALIVATAGVAAVKLVGVGPPVFELVAVFTTATALLAGTFALLGVDDEEREVFEQISRRVRRRGAGRSDA